jgi:hypothetical protein
VSPKARSPGPHDRRRVPFASQRFGLRSIEAQAKASFGKYVIPGAMSNKRRIACHW